MPVEKVPTVPAAPSKYTYGTRQVCDGNQCHVEQIATYEGRQGCFVLSNGQWQWEAGESYEIVDGVAYLPGEPVRKAARVSRRAAGRVVTAGRRVVRVASAPARFVLRRCCR